MADKPDKQDLNVSDYDTCKDGGGKLHKAADGTLVCTIYGKDYKQGKKPFTDSKSTDTSTPVPAVAKKKFTEFSIKSDGTKGGTKFLVNGEEVPNLAVASFAFYNDNYGSNVSLSFSTRDPKPEPGTLAETTYFSLIPPAPPSSTAAVASATPAEGFIRQVAHDPKVMPRDNKIELYRQI